jgi:iodotyrosine deiodinase
MPLPHIPYRPLAVAQEQGRQNLLDDLALMRSRRSIRKFSDRPVPKQMIETAIRIAATAPSGANRQPWTFVAISDPATKRRIREEAEAAEKEFYEERAPKEWLEALEPLGTDFHKEYLEVVPWIIVVFRRDADIVKGERVKNYYVPESVGIAVGFFIQALHHAGLCTLTHTPAPMTFLREICGRPLNEKPFLLMPVGYAADDCTVPDITKLPIETVLHFL